LSLRPSHSRPRRHDLELATKLDHSESYLSRAVGDLVEKGLVYTERDGRRKRVVPSDARAVERYRDLVRQHSHIEFPELLTGKALEVLYYLDQPRTVSEIADRSDNYRNTVNRVLKRFRDRGLVGTADGRYEFNADFDRIHEFARELAHHLHRHRLEAVAPKGTILWEDYDEFLAQAETEIDAEAFHETGLARFAPSTSSSCSPAIATTSTPRSSTPSRQRSSAVTRC